MEKTAHSSPTGSETSFPTKMIFSPWPAYALAVGLLILVVLEMRQVTVLKSDLVRTRADLARQSASNALVGLEVAQLEARDPAYATARVLVAWDPNQDRGVLMTQNLPIAPAGHDYQLWVLDPTAQTPLGATLVSPKADSARFAIGPVQIRDPGFALTLEPTGGSRLPTTRSILFAVSPGR